jgi:hypothetical protein
MHGPLPIRRAELSPSAPSCSSARSSTPTPPGSRSARRPQRRRLLVAARRRQPRPHRRSAPHRASRADLVLVCGGLGSRPRTTSPARRSPTSSARRRCRPRPRGRAARALRRSGGHAGRQPQAGLARSRAPRRCRTPTAPRPAGSCAPSARWRRDGRWSRCPARRASCCRCGSSRSSRGSVPRRALRRAAFKTFGIGESHVAERAGRVDRAAANPSVATYAKRDGVHVRVAAKADDEAAAARARSGADEVARALGARLGRGDEDELAELVLGRLAAPAGSGGARRRRQGGALIDLLDEARRRPATRPAARRRRDSMARRRDGRARGA